MVVSPPISVAVARFEDIVTRGLRALVEDDDYLRLISSDVPQDQLPAMLEAERPDVAIINFGSLSSAADLRELHRAFPDTRLVVLANRPTAAECRQLLAFGATACLSKSTQARDVLHAIHLASRGMQVLPPIGLEAHGGVGPEMLTPREADVLELLQNGSSNGEIAHTLHVSVETVRTHTRRVYRKLGVRSRRELQALR
jgi:two-component system, NarL family, response regulator DesR